MKDSALVLHGPLNYLDYEKMTAGYTKWHSLLWNNLPPVPTWITSVGTLETEARTDGNEETETPAAGTSSSSSTGTGSRNVDSLIQEALATALLLVTKATDKK
jgi:hypothetical protein